jgi:hypothetical protein
MNAEPRFEEGDDVAVRAPSPPPGDWDNAVVGIVQKIRPDGMGGWLYDVEVSTDLQTTTMPEVPEARLRISTVLDDRKEPA